MAAATLLLLWGLSASAQSWSTVDDFEYSLGESAFATGLAKDPSGTIVYSAGDAQDASGGFHGVAFKSSDGGLTWTLMDDYMDGAAPPYYGPGYDAGIAADTAGNIYAAGYIDPATGAIVWFTRRSTDGGATWSTVDTLSGGQPRAIAADAAGNVYVVGQVQSNWIVRKGSGGTSWSTVAQSVVPTGGNSPNWTAVAVFCHPTAGIFVVGQGLGAPIKSAGKTVYPQVWTVRRSQDGGATWTTVDSYQLVPNSTYTSGANGLGADPAGNLYIVGWASGTAKPPQRSTTHWIVRKSADGGNSWSTADDFVSSPQGQAQAFGSDSNGNLFVAGYNGSWLVREFFSATGTWQPVDTFQYVSGKGASPAAVLGDSSGRVFTAGYANDASGVEHWIVRKH